ncbi:hypothetical protein QJS04_geneDACA013967 [Acorus gramineus]|uniref:Uncharacterized protein n=1 Tax=Acorus gramineus TaxID=55184 RepID=A0AAV9AV75_ACOGR|nr:hypothetical protein QJS04_geneDACA013967 [Acorus gramineus]
MGCVFSNNSSTKFDSVRVVHLNGFVEDFSEPIMVKEMKPPKHVICSAAHLLSFGTQPLRPEDRLEPGRVYFLLPHSVFMSETSPLDLASLANRLTNIAQRVKMSRPKSRSGPVRVQDRPVQGLFGCSGSSPSRGLSELGQVGSRVGSWKPVLETIEERALGGSMSLEVVPST